MKSQARISATVSGRDISIRDVFTAKHFGEQMFDGKVDPVVMLDHFQMTGPTFEPHPHAGISAVTYVFEDSVGSHYNYDSLGNRGPIKPGALHWFCAGRGAVHTERPIGKDQGTHALQIFVNLPASKKMCQPFAVHAEPEDIPELSSEGVRVRAVVGESQGVRAAHTDLLPEPFTILDGFLEGTHSYEHDLPDGWNALVYVVSGDLKVVINGHSRELSAAGAVGVSSQSMSEAQAVKVRLVPQGTVHFIVLSGPALNEPMVKHGPMVMNTMQQIEERMASYARGDFGHLNS